MSREFSGNAIKRLGKALRSGPIDGKLILDLEDYRATFDPLLIDLSLQIEELLKESDLPFLLTGRSKRTKSIIRKLKRSQNRGMDLSRMGDIVGLRLLVADHEAQDQALKQILEHLEIKEVHDYRERPPKSGYRCIHILVRKGKRLLEIQLRTLAQHLWAVESESFGEKVKEGTVPAEIEAYLQVLQGAIVSIESGEGDAPTDEDLTPLGVKRSPLKAFLPRMIEQFAEATAAQSDDQPPFSYLLVYDSMRAQLIQELRYEGASREEALAHYSVFSRMVDEERFDVIVLNASSPIGMRVTHPRYFQ